MLARSEQQEYGDIHPLLSSGGSGQGWNIAKDPKLLVSSGPGQLVAWLGMASNGCSWLHKVI